MKRWLAVALAAALVWVLARELHVAARVWTAVLLVALPALMVNQARQLHAIESLPRRGAYLSSIASLWLLAALTAGAAALAGFRLDDLAIRQSGFASVIFWTTSLTAAGIGVLFLFRALGFREAPIMHELLPHSRADRSIFAVLSVTAGVCEEFVFRGFLLHALGIATGSLPMAVILSSGAFGIVHAYQQPIGALRATLLGAILAVPLLAGQSLLPAILAHSLIDLLAGLWLARYLLR